MQALLNEILDQVRPLIGQGKVADYIPALADVPANQLGIAVYSNDGELYCFAAFGHLFCKHVEQCCHALRAHGTVMRP